MMNIYGLRNCDTCRKARKALDAANIAYAFHDLREESVSKAQIAKWAKAAGFEAMLNRSSATWRGLTDADKTGVNETKAVALMAAHPALIKRPLVALDDGAVLVGWTAETQAAVGLL
jgi:Spx/MgsR family transcriptional regulator